VNPSYRRHQVVAAERLLQKLACPRQHGVTEGLVLGIQRQHDDARLGQVLGQHLGGLDAVHAGQPGVDDGDIGVRPQRLLNGQLAVRRRGADDEVRFGAKPPHEVLGDPRRLVGDQDPDHRGHSIPAGVISSVPGRNAAGWSPLGGALRAHPEEPPWRRGRGDRRGGGAVC
jgi:hypothetical protein